jgi:hypothetical protein
MQERMDVVVRPAETRTDEAEHAGKKNVCGNFLGSFFRMSIAKKPKRENWDSDARRLLEMKFDECKLPTGENLQRIADQIGTTRRRAQVYFQNRRQRSTTTGKKAKVTPVDDEGSSYMVPECPSFASTFEGEDDTPHPSERTRSGAIVDEADAFTAVAINIDALIESLDATSGVGPGLLLD